MRNDKILFELNFNNKVVAFAVSVLFAIYSGAQVTNSAQNSSPNNTQTSTLSENYPDYSQSTQSQDKAEIKSKSGVKIDSHKICKNVFNGAGKSLFVPLKQGEEWARFLEHKPSQVAVSDCIVPVIPAPPVVAPVTCAFCDLSGPIKLSGFMAVDCSNTEVGPQACNYGSFYRGFCGPTACTSVPPPVVTPPPPAPLPPTLCTCGSKLIKGRTWTACGANPNVPAGTCEVTASLSNSLPPIACDIGNPTWSCALVAAAPSCTPGFVRADGHGCCADQTNWSVTPMPPTPGKTIYKFCGCGNAPEWSKIQDAAGTNLNNGC